MEKEKKKTFETAMNMMIMYLILVSFCNIIYLCIF